MSEAKFKWGDGPMPEALLEAFYTDVNKLIKQHFGTDSDGDYPVEVEIVDRTRFNGMHYHQLPYDHRNAEDGGPVSDEEFRRILRLAAGNVAMAADDMRREMDIYNMRHERAEEKNTRAKS